MTPPMTGSAIAIDEHAAAVLDQLGDEFELAGGVPDADGQLRVVLEAAYRCGYAHSSFRAGQAGPTAPLEPEAEAYGRKVLKDHGHGRFAAGAADSERWACCHQPRCLAHGACKSLSIVQATSVRDHAAGLSSISEAAFGASDHPPPAGVSRQAGASSPSMLQEMAAAVDEDGELPTGLLAARALPKSPALTPKVERHFGFTHILVPAGWTWQSLGDAVSSAKCATTKVYAIAQRLLAELHGQHITNSQLHRAIAKQRKRAEDGEALAQRRSAELASTVCQVERLAIRVGELGGLDPLHPFGRCACGGEGRCAWCQIECEHGKKRMEFCGDCDDAAMVANRAAESEPT